MDIRLFRHCKDFTTEYTELKEFTEIVSQDCANFIDHQFHHSHTCYIKRGANLDSSKSPRAKPSVAKPCRRPASGLDWGQSNVASAVI